jgi:hypothetical protein
MKLRHRYSGIIIIVSVLFIAYLCAHAIGRVTIERISRLSDDNITNNISQIEIEAQIVTILYKLKCVSVRDYKFSMNLVSHYEMRFYETANDFNSALVMCDRAIQNANDDELTLYIIPRYRFLTKLGRYRDAFQWISQYSNLIIAKKILNSYDQANLALYKGLESYALRGNQEYRSAVDRLFSGIKAYDAYEKEYSETRTRANISANARKVLLGESLMLLGKLGSEAEEYKVRSYIKSNEIVVSMDKYLLACMAYYTNKNNDTNVNNRHSIDDRGTIARVYGFRIP